MTRYILIILMLVVSLGTEAQRARRLKRHRAKARTQIVAKPLTNANAWQGRRGIIILDDSVKGVRAFEPFKGNSEAAAQYADLVNSYKKAFPEVNVYCMVIPNAVAIYCPDSLKAWTKDEGTAIKELMAKLDADVTGVSILDTLRSYSEEPIYSRTDHHWAPLGAYYAARVFAQMAATDYRALKEYDARTIHDYVGSMWTFTRDMKVKASPEDFVYYVPKDSSFEAQRIVYRKVKKRIGRRRYQTALMASEPESYRFFRHYDDGDGAAYCVFMGGDQNTTSVVTGHKNGRRLMILKDSYGNALPAFLFGSFEEIHVVDCRNFLQNMRTFVKEKGITDMLFANNLIHANMPNIVENYRNFLRQNERK